MVIDKRLGQLLLITAASGAAIYARSAVGPLQEVIRTDLALSDTQIALLQGPAIALPLAVTAIPLGVAIDRYSRVRLVFTLTLLNLLGSACTVMAPTFAWLLAARCVIGVSGTSTYLVALSLLSDLYRAHQRGRAAMIVTFGSVMGMSAAFSLGGMLLGVYPSGAGWRMAMLWLSSPLVVVALLVLNLREPPRHEVRIERPSRAVVLRELQGYRAMILPLVFGLSMIVVADGASTVWTAPTLARRFHLSPDHYGAIMASVLLASGIAGPLVGGFVADACHRAGGPLRTLSALSWAALLSIPAALFAVTPSPAALLILLVIFMTIGVGFNVVVPTLLTILLPNELRGICLTLCSATCMLSAFGVAPLAVSLLSEAMGQADLVGKSLAAVCVSSSLIAAGIFAWVRRYSKERIAQTEDVAT